jgi:transcriptional regulator with AAA-type ATPase domain
MFGRAHHGVLFLDELPEFPRLVLEYSLFNIQITNHMQSDLFVTQTIRFIQKIYWI